MIRHYYVALIRSTICKVSCVSLVSLASTSVERPTDRQIQRCICV